MDCAAALEAMSAELDGEAEEAEQLVLSVHLKACPSCRFLKDQFHAAQRSVRVRVAEPTPNLVPSVMALARPPRLGKGEWIRYSLGLVAGTNLILGLPVLFLRSGGGHVDRHLGAFTVAVSIGLLFAALRPERAYGLVPVAVALVATMVAGGVADTLGGQQSIAAESRHLLDLIGMVLLWLLGNGRLPGVMGWSVFSRSERAVA